MPEDTMLKFAEQFDAIFDGPQFDIADEIFAPNFVAHLPLVRNLDLEDWKHYVANLYIGISDLREEVNEVIVSEDRLVLRVTYSGTHDGPLFRTRATGRTVIFDGMCIFRFNEQDQATEIWGTLDLVGLLEQIGDWYPQSNSAPDFYDSKDFL